MHPPIIPTGHPAAHACPMSLRQRDITLCHLCFTAIKRICAERRKHIFHIQYAGNLLFLSADDQFYRQSGIYSDFLQLARIFLVQL